MKTRLGIVLSTVTDHSIGELVTLGQLAEKHGFDAVYVNEGRGDAIAAAQAIGHATRRIVVGTNIANVYFRHPYLAAHAARTAAEITEGRFILGLGMSHRSMLAALGIDMGDARTRLREYLHYVREALEGRAADGFLKPSPSPFRVPVYGAGNTIESAAVAGAVADGLMPFLSPVHYLPPLLDACRNAAGEPSADRAAPGCILSIPTFVSDDVDAARSAARYNLAFFSQLPNYRRQWRRAGYATAMNALQNIWDEGGSRSEAAAQVPDELVDSVCVHGPAEQCREQLQAFRQAGVDEPVLAVSPVNEARTAATERAIAILAPKR